MSKAGFSPAKARALDPVRTASAGPRALVVGAGISGLSAAYRLQQAGFRVQVLEASSSIGGRMSSVQMGGFTMSRGALILPGAHRAIVGLAAELGLGELPPFHGTIAIEREGQLHRLRSDKLPLDGMRTKLVSWRTKARLWRLALDGLRVMPTLSSLDISSAAAFDTQTALDYCERYLGTEARNYLIGPVTRGLCDDASIVEFFNASLNILGTGFLRFPGGIHFLVEALAARLEVHTRARVLALEPEGAGVRVSWETCETAGEPSVEHSEQVEACVLAVPAPTAAELYRAFDAQAADLMAKGLRYNRAVLGHFCLSRRTPAPALFILVPEIEDPGMYSLSFEHALRPATVPEGKGQLMTNWSHTWCEAHRELDDEALIEQMLPSVERLVPGVRDQIELARVDRWTHAVLRGEPGYCATIAQLGQRIDPRSPLQLAGDYFTTSSTNSSALAGERAAARLIETAGLSRA